MWSQQLQGISENNRIKLSSLFLCLPGELQDPDVILTSSMAKSLI